MRAPIVRRPSSEEPDLPVMILDREGRAVRMVPAPELRDTQVAGAPLVPSDASAPTPRRRRPVMDGKYGQ
jgi:hypothetical protein